MTKPQAMPPRQLDVQATCRDGRSLQGELPLATMPRLAASLYGQLDAATCATWAAQGLTRPVAGSEPELWLHLQADAVVQLQCQRCLQAMAQSLVVDRRFLFVRREEDAERLDEELEDDVLALPQRLDLAELLEDELILALPLVPRHAGACPQPLPLLATESATADESPHPFAGLAALRGKLAGGGRGEGGT